MTKPTAPSSFEAIGIVGRLGSDNVAHTVMRLTQLLIREGKRFAVDEPLAQAAGDLNCPRMSRDELGAWADLIIVVGGDGTLLGAARDLARYEVPLLGINRGRLGFLTDIMPFEMEAGVMAVLGGDYVAEDRFLLQARVLRDGEELDAGCALNDVVLHSGQSIRMIEFELYIDDQFVYSQRSDGLIVSTPDRLHRLRHVGRRAAGAPQPGRHDTGAHVPAQPEQPAHCRWRRRPAAHPCRTGHRRVAAGELRCPEPPVDPGRR